MTFAKTVKVKSDQVDSKWGLSSIFRLLTIILIYNDIQENQ